MRTSILTLLIFLFTASCFGQVNMSQGLQLYLPFNGNAQDMSGNANNGVVNGATLTTDQNSLANSAYYFDGINDKIEIPHSSSISSNIMTVCAKVQMRGFYNGFCYNNVILNKGLDYNSPNSYFSLRTTQTINGNCSFQDTTQHNYRFDINGNGSLQFSTINNTPYVSVNEDSWDCLVGTYDGSTQKLYVNGVLRYQNPVAPKPLNTSDLTIGWYKENAVYPFWFKGSIDEIRVYNRILNTDEINHYCEIPFPQSINDFEDKLDIIIHPNPSSNEVNIDLKNIDNDGQLSVTTAEGKTILKKSIKRKSLELLDISKFANGLYFLNIQIGSKYQTYKFLKN